MHIIHPARRAILARWAEAGLAQVQDPTSALVIQHADIHPGQIILDRCAGLGTKTMQMRDLLGENGAIIAVDASRARCEALRRLIAHRALQNITVYETDHLHVSSRAEPPQAAQSRDLGNPDDASATNAALIPDLPLAFDRILIDVPCSNSGVLARRPEARYHQSPRNLKSLEKLQNMILDDTAPFLAPGGLLIYSTCSIWPEENQHMIRNFLTRHPQFQQIEEKFTLPSTDPDPARYRDGGYFAVLRRHA